MEGKSNSIARALSSLWGSNGSSNLESGQTDSAGSGTVFGLVKIKRFHFLNLIIIFRVKRRELLDFSYV